MADHDEDAEGAAKAAAGDAEGAAKAAAGGANGAAKAAAGGANGRAAAGDAASERARLAALRGRAVTAVGEIALAMGATPRYRDQSLGDLRTLVLEPLMRDRIAIARPKGPEGADAAQVPVAGVALWATVSEDVDARIRRQIEAGVFPIRLKPQDWTSGDTVWLLDVIAPTRKAAMGVVSSFRQLSGGGAAKVHPVVTEIVGREALAAMLGGAGRRAAAGGGAAPAAPHDGSEDGG